jgi:hypothetical protein
MVSSAVEPKANKQVFREERSLILRQLTRRVGILPASVEAEVQLLTLDQLEALGEALLDFAQLGDLTDWLTSNS